MPSATFPTYCFLAAISWALMGAAGLSAQTNPGTPSAGEILPSLPADKARALWDSCTLIDYVFFDYPISMSLDQQQSIRAVLRHIGGSAPAVLSSVCQPVGKVYYQIQGRIAWHASLFLSEECAYFVFYEGEEKKYANLMTSEAYQFYTKTLAGVKH